MISGNPSSKCLRIWLQIRPTFDTSFCTELKGLISKWSMLSLACLLKRGSMKFCPETSSLQGPGRGVQHFPGGPLANFYGYP